MSFSLSTATNHLTHHHSYHRRYPKEGEVEAPDRMCLSKANDADFEAQVKAFESTGATITPAPLVCSSRKM